MGDGQVGGAEQIQTARMGTQPVFLPMKRIFLELRLEWEPREIGRAAHDDAAAAVARFYLEVRSTHAAKIMGQLGRCLLRRRRGVRADGYREEGLATACEFHGCGSRLGGPRVLL